jgi:hypothetical protein
VLQTAWCTSTNTPRNEESRLDFSGRPSIWFGLAPGVLDSRASDGRRVGLVVAAHDAPILPALDCALGKNECFGGRLHGYLLFDTTLQGSQLSPLSGDILRGAATHRDRCLFIVGSHAPRTLD